MNFDFEKRCDFCINGQEAYERVILAYERGLSYKLILTDFSMPILDGITATKKIRAHLTKKMKISIDQ
jgi:CheY-like chemotaxis protein